MVGENEHAIDHFRDPGTHEGDTHVFVVAGQSIKNHYLAGSGGNKLCWCDPVVTPTPFGCEIAHSQKTYAEYRAECALRAEAHAHDARGEDE